MNYRSRAIRMLLSAPSKLRGRLRKIAPDLTVVVPVYNVEDYLEECLDSILQETELTLQVVAVDDGSTDGSPAILKRVAGQDRRVEIVRKANAGLGAARNTGALQAKGRYIAFIDSDDVVERGAFKRVVEILDETASDFAVTPYRHLRDGKLQRPAFWIRSIHSARALSVDVNLRPDAFANVVAWSKVYRHSFWTEKNLSYPEGVIWEDQQAAARSYLEAKAFDILEFPIVRWRQRSGGSKSITQRHAEESNLRERFEQSAAVLKILSDAGRADMAASRAVDFLANRTFSLENLRFCEPGYWNVMRAGVTELLEYADAEDYARRVDAQDKVVYSHVLGDDVQAVREFYNAGGAKVVEYEPVTVDGRVYFSLPGFDRANPQPEYRAADRQLESQTYLRELNVSPDSIWIRGNAYFANLETELGDTRHVALLMTELTSGAVLPLEALRERDHTAALRTKHFFNSYAGSGFSAQIDMSLVEAWLDDQGIRRARLQIEVVHSQSGLEDRAAFRGRDAKTGAGTPNTVFTSRGNIVIPRWEQPGGLMIDIRPAPVVVVGCEASADGSGFDLLVKVGAKSFRPKFATASADNHETRVALRDLGWPRYSLHLSGDLAALSLAGSSLQLHDASGAVRQVHADRSVVSRGTRAGDVVLHVPHHSRLEVWDASSIAYVKSWDVDGSALVLGLKDALPDVVESVSLNRRHTRLEGVISAGRNVVSFDLMRVEAAGWSDTMPPPGGYSLELGMRGGRASRAVYWSDPTDVLGASRPLGDAGQTLTARVTADERVELLVGDEEPRRQTGPRWGELLRAYSASSAIDVAGSRTVYMQCLRGDQVNDNQLALFYELQRRGGWDVVWGIADPSVSIPDGSRSVLIGSPEYFHTLRTAGYLCFNHEVPPYLVKSVNQKVIQTYHGHPFKAMGVRRWRDRGMNELQMDRALAIRRHWDYLLSPGPVATRLYSENFPVPAEIVEVGHPRNDRLALASDDERKALRAALGVPEGAVAILLAPTWRDYSATDPWSSKVPEFIQPELLADMLGAPYVVLFRGHPAHGRSGVDFDERDNLVDVTYWPDVNDLLIAADIGVYDYSSIRFDHAVTRRPMVFFVPDLERYFAEVPPLLDYERTAPGPMVRTTKELVTTLKRIDPVEWTPDPVYQGFVADFVPFDDGSASERFVDAVFAKEVNDVR